MILFKAGLTSADSFKEAMKGCELVIHIIAKANGRHILATDAINVLEIAKMPREKYQIPENALPGFPVYFAGPFQRFTWEYLKRNPGISYNFENACSKSGVGMEYRRISETFADHAAQLEQDGLI